VAIVIVSSVYNHLYENDLQKQRSEMTFSKDKTLIAQIAERADSIPDQTAIVFEEKTVSYGELQEKSAQLANFLQLKGVQKEDLVPVCVSNPMDMVIGILAILKSGGAYVPFDPDFPVDRIKYMIEDTAAKVVLSDSPSTNFVTAAAGKTIVLADLQQEEIAAMPKTIDISGIGPADLAYVIYTSGSTGRPKGALIEQRNVTDYMQGALKHIPLAICRTFVLGTSMATDQGSTTLYGALVLGAELHLFRKELFNDLEYIHQYFKTHTIDFLKLVPSHWKSLSLDGQDLLPRKLMMLGGEALHTTILGDFLKGPSDICALVNHYGPTETTIGSMMHQIDHTKPYEHTIPIGKVFCDETAYILDADLKEVEGDGIGEVYIGGAGVGRGYLNRPELTAERYLKDPFSTNENARMYRTGDLARRTFDGNFQFLGRIDDQVKVRGYRIELGEIESVLQHAPGVKYGVVMARETGDGDKRLIGYVICPEKYDKQAIITYLEGKLPGFMVPQLLMRLDAFQFLPNGKVNKKLLPDPDASSLLTNTYYAPNYKTEAQLTEIWTELLGVKRVGIEDNFFELGGNSLLAQKIVTALKKRHQLVLPVTKIFQFPTVKGLASFLDGRKTNTALKKNKKTGTQQNADVAIIGMAGRFPGANTIEELWQVLKNGQETTSFFSDEDLDPSVPPALRNHPDYVRAKGLIEDVKGFDAAFFGITPKLAELMDPQQRIFLEIAWEALEKTGYAGKQYDGSIGVFAGVGHNTYYENNVLPNPELIEKAGRTQLVSVSAKDYISSRTAYALDLKGPAVSVQSACSTSLLAVAQAVQSIRSGQCEMALAGGVVVNSPVKTGHLYEAGAMLSNDGHCRPFDADAEGTIFSDGAGVVLLKNKEEAIKDGDLIFATIKGIGVNNDGGGKGSFTAPSAEGQAAAIRMAIDDAGLDPAAIGYVEAHGTATPLGDPIEIEGLKLAFGEQAKNQYCAIGSIKSNFGHLTVAAGVAGLIKTALALHHKQIPPSLNYHRPNPNIDFEHSPFIVNAALTDWQGGAKRIAGVSSFGVGGTNVHVVLEEEEIRPAESSASRPVQLLTWSAKNEKSLQAFSQQLGVSLLNSTGADFADQAFTLNTFRAEFKYRSFAVAADGNELADKTKDPSKLISIQHKNIREVVFMFPGQGSQFLDMGKELYQQEPVFREAMDECNTILKTIMGEDLLAVIYPAAGTPKHPAAELSRAEEKIKDTRYSQPALFITGYALSKLWMSWGVYPSAFIGHSIGEFVAAYFSGIFSLPDVLQVIAKRGQLMSDLPAGDMLSIRAKADDILAILPADLSLAAVNSPLLCVVAGTTAAVSAFSSLLDKREIANRLLPTSHAFHSYMMDSVVDPFKEILSGLSLNPPAIPVYSTVTGEMLTDKNAVNPAYWANHLRATVQFAAAAKNLLEEHADKAFLELGPGNAAATFIRQQPAGKNSTIITSLEKPAAGETAYHTILKAAGTLWASGIDLDWSSFYQHEQRSRSYQLPGYVFNKSDYWVSAPKFLHVSMLPPPAINPQPIQNRTPMRKQILISKIKDILEDTSGIEMNDVSPETSFIEMGLDSLLLTQISIALKKNFNAAITFRQLNEEYNNLDQLAAYLDTQLPADEETANQSGATASHAPAQPAEQTPQQFQPQNHQAFQPQYQPQAAQYQSPATQYQQGYQPAYPQNGFAAGYPPQNNGSAVELISQQLQLLAMQLALLQGNQAPQAVVPATAYPPSQPVPPVQNPQTNGKAPVMSDKLNLKPVADLRLAELSPEEQAEIKKPFGASPRIEKQSAALTAAQQQYLAELTERYTSRTKTSKAYTQENRAHMADPRVVSGFKPATKELVYSVVINKSRGSRFWDIDGNEYVDAVNGFGSNMLGYQPDVIKKALIEQIDKGYEIGPQHELAGEVSKLICEFTNFDRSALCNTGSEAILGAMRIARTVTGRSLIVAFTGSYHGIVDEVIVRGSKKHKTFPAAPGIMPEAVQNMLILDYGTDETLQIIKDRAHELAAVLVEPVQSRRPDFLPIDFLKEIRQVTEASGTALIFDEVISGFRFHPAGLQGITGIQADLGTYGKVAGGGISIGIIAGKRKFMDALDGGFWQFGDDSIPEVGVTYFAGTFVRHPLALATSKASLTYMKEQGPLLQQGLNERTKYIADSLNTIIRRLNVPMFIAQFGSLWRVRFLEEYPYTELFFTLMRYKGIHILEGFSCFLTTSHSQADIDLIINTFEECLVELKKVDFIPEYSHAQSTAASPAPSAINTASADAPVSGNLNTPPVPGARLGKDKDGNPGWFIKDEQNPGKYLQVN
jgi:amino acid adenylation domain-containing protein